MGSFTNPTMAMILEIALLVGLVHLLKSPASDWEKTIRWVARRPEPLALAPAPAPVKARRSRAKVAA